MERDKRGRFVKKALNGTQLLPTLQLRNGKKYKLRQGVSTTSTEPWLALAMQDPDKYEMYLESYYEPLQEVANDVQTENSTTTSLNVTTPQKESTFNVNTIVPPNGYYKLDVPSLNLPETDLLGTNNKEQVLKNQALFGVRNQFKTPKIKYTVQNGKYVDEYGKELNPATLDFNVYERDFNIGSDYGTSSGDIDVDSNTDKTNVKSSGMTLTDVLSDKSKNAFGSGIVDKTKLANFLEVARAGIGFSVNNKIAERALKSEKPFLQDVSESHRSVYGNYRAQIEGEKAAAKLRNMAANPMTSDGALQQQLMLDAQIKGQEYIDQGRAQDEAMIKQTREVAWQQEKENQQQRQAVAMQNRQAMLMTEKNKAQIENARDSANFSQVLSPLLAGNEQRLRNEGKKQEYYQDYYNDALVDSEVWNTFETELTPEQKILRQKYINEGATALNTYIGTDPTRNSEWNKLYQIMNNEIIRRKAALKNVYINPASLNGASIASKYPMWESSSMNFKKGGTIYKAKLTKRTKDNDRAAKSIESSKKIAARLLEKAIDSLYDYNEVEIIAKPGKKKRKYQAGGGLPFVNFTPVFATSESGAPAVTETKKDKKGEDLTNKDLLELLKEVDGLPSDINAIQTLMSDFIISDKMDPLGLDSSSSIAARYMSLIGKIKIAKSNKEWYDKAYERLRSNNALNELAVDSRGSFIGMNPEGDFARFTAQQIASGDIGTYQMLTNSELLDIRANTSLAPFDANVIMEAANGISMDQINDHISKVIQGLGSDKQQTQIFGDQSKDVLAGLKQLQAAAQEVGQDLSISQLYEASIFNENQANQAQLALSYLYETLPTNMKALLFAKAKSQEGVYNLINNLVNSKLSKTTKLEFSPKNTRKATTSSKTGNVTLDGLELSPAQMLQQGFGERETITIQDSSSTGLQVQAITMPVTKDGNEPIGAATLEDVATSQYGGILNFTNASMGGQLIPFEGRRNIAVDGSKIYSMYLPIDQDAFMRGEIIPDISLIDKVNAVNKTIKEKQITNPREINTVYEEAGLPVYLNDDGTVVPGFYRRFGVLNGTAIDNAFGKTFLESKYLKKVDDEDVINNAINIMNQGRGKEDRIEYDAKNFFNFGGLLGDYDTIYQGTIFIPMSNDVFLGIAGSGKNITSTEANDLEAKQQQHERVSATYKNPGQLR